MRTRRIRSSIAIGMIAASSLAPGCAHELGPDEEPTGLVAAALSEGTQLVWFGASGTDVRVERGAPGAVDPAHGTAGVELTLPEGRYSVAAYGWSFDGQWYSSSDEGGASLTVGARSARNITIETHRIGSPDLATSTPALVASTDAAGVCSNEAIGRIRVQGEPGSAVSLTASAGEIGAVRFIPDPLAEHCWYSDTWTTTASGVLSADGEAIFDFGLVPGRPPGFERITAGRVARGETLPSYIQLFVRRAGDVGVRITTD